MPVKIEQVSQQNQQGGEQRGRVFRDYAGTVGGKLFRVQICETEAPHWYDCDLDEDEQADVLDAIENN